MAATARRLESQFRLPTTAIPILLPPLPPVDSALPEAIQALKGARKLTTGAELIEALERRRRHQVVPTAIDAVDKLLDGGLPRGKMTEIAGFGARLSIAVAALASATSTGEAAAFIDLADCFDPQLGDSAGINLHRMLWVRPKTLRQAVSAAEMLVSTGFQLVVLDAGLPPLRGRVPDASWVRLARASEAHGSALLVSAPYPLTGTTSEAMLRASWAGGRWRGGLLTGVEATLRLEKHRRKRSGETARVCFEAIESLAVGCWPLAEEAIGTSQLSAVSANRELRTANNSLAEGDLSANGQRSGETARVCFEAIESLAVGRSPLAEARTDSTERMTRESAGNREASTANGQQPTANHDRRTANG